VLTLTPGARGGRNEAGRRAAFEARKRRRCGIGSPRGSRYGERGAGISGRVVVRRRARTYVREVASELAKHGVKAFFDEENEIRLWGKNLVEEFQRIFMTDSHVVVMFISKEYAQKEWPRHERRSALTRALRERREYVLPVRFDDSVLPGLDPDALYLPLDVRSPTQLAREILEKLIALGGRIEPPTPSFRSSAVAASDSAVCRVTVTDHDGNPIHRETVHFIAHNGTTTQGRTGQDGIAEVPARVRRNVAVFVAHSQHRGAYLPQHDNGAELQVTLPTSGSGHSAIFADQTGHIPGFTPGLNPIGQAHDTQAVPSATYMYVTNGSVDGKSQQPFFFRVGQPMILEDSEGHQVWAACVGFVGVSTLWEYEFPDEDSGEAVSTTGTAS
jgi:hypothetical protein